MITIDGGAPGSTIPTGFIAGKLDVPGGLPENDGIVLLMWKPGSDLPAISWDKMDASDKWGKAVNVLIHFILAQFGRRIARVLRETVDYYEARLYDPEVLKKEQPDGTAGGSTIQGESAQEESAAGSGPGDEVRPS